MPYRYGLNFALGMETICEHGATAADKLVVVRIWVATYLCSNSNVAGKLENSEERLALDSCFLVLGCGPLRVSGHCTPSLEVRKPNYHIRPLYVTRNQEARKDLFCRYGRPHA